MSNLGFDIGIENIIFGNASFENDKNSKLFLLVQKYIVNSLKICLVNLYIEYTSDDNDLVYIYVSDFVFKDKYYTKLTLIYFRQ